MGYYSRRIKARNEKMFNDFVALVKDRKYSIWRAFDTVAGQAEPAVRVYQAKRIIRNMALQALGSSTTGQPTTVVLRMALSGTAGAAAAEAGSALEQAEETGASAQEMADPTEQQRDEEGRREHPEAYKGTEGDVVGMSRETRQLLAAVKNRVPALCIGETGTGKTTIVKKVGEQLGREVVRVNLDGGVTPDEIIGRYQAKAENGVTVTYFQEGVVPRAMRAGAILLLDELNAALPDTLFCLHSLLEAEPRLFIPETQEEIIPAEGFAIVATMNPSHEYAGTKGLNAALYSRFGMVIRFEPLTGAALRKAILTHVPGVEGKPVLERICRIIEVVATLRKEEKVSTRLTLREGIAAARFVAEGDLSETEAVSAAMLAKLETYEKDAVLAGGGR